MISRILRAGYLVECSIWFARCIFRSRNVNAARIGEAMHSSVDTVGDMFQLPTKPNIPEITDMNAVKTNSAKTRSWAACFSICLTRDAA